MFTFRVPFRAMVAASSPRLVYTNKQFVNTTGEGNPADTVTVKASIELRDGTLWPVFFGGVREKALAPGESVTSDARDLREQNGDLPWDGKTVRDLDERDRKERFMVMLVTVAAILAFKNDGVGFITGLVWYWGFQGARKLEAWREERAGLPFWRHAEHTRPELMRLIAQEESDTIA